MKLVTSPLTKLQWKIIKGSNSFNDQTSKQHCILSSNSLGTLQKLQINYFAETSVDGNIKLTSDISLKSVPQQSSKISRASDGTKQGKIFFFLVWFLQFKQKLGEMGWIVLFYNKILQWSFWKMETKSHSAVPVLYWYYFNVNQITRTNKENISSFLLSKKHEINFYHQLLTRLCSTKREQFVLNMKRYYKEMVLFWELSKV